MARCPFHDDHTPSVKIDDRFVDRLKWTDTIRDYLGDLHIGTDRLAKWVRRTEPREGVLTEPTECILQSGGTTAGDLADICRGTAGTRGCTDLAGYCLIPSILAQEMLVLYNVAAKASPPIVRRTSPDYCQPDEMNEILDALDNEPVRWKAITYLLIDTGCRRGEIMGLKWSKVNFDTSVITIDCALLCTPQRGAYEDPTKTNEARAVKIAPQTLEVLKQWKEEYERLKELNGDRWADAPYVFVQDVRLWRLFHSG